MLQGELTHHLWYEKHAVEGRNGGNSGNGTAPKSVETGQGELALEVPRDREGSFTLQTVPKGGSAVYPASTRRSFRPMPRGMTVAEIQGHREELSATGVSPGLISDVTDAVLGQVKAWQCRPVSAVYPIL